MNKCPNCLEKIDSDSAHCRFCGAYTADDSCAEISAEADVSGEKDFPKLKPYYRRLFKYYEAEGGKPSAKWNWAAFLFGFFWYISKGMALKALILFFLSYLLPGGGIFSGIYCGMFGNYDYYLLKVKGKQLW